MNKKGFTLVELLAVIVILGLLATVAILSMSNVLENARKDTYLANARAAIDAARNDYMINNPTKWSWSLTEINALLEKKLTNTPYGGTYATGSYVVRTTAGTYKICLQGNNAAAGSIAGSSNAAVVEEDLSRSSVVKTSVTCTVPTSQPAS